MDKPDRPHDPLLDQKTSQAINRKFRRAERAGMTRAERAELAAIEREKKAAARELERREAADEVARERARESFFGEHSHRRLNIYTCDKCREHIVTEDKDSGVTPFMIPCEFCVPGKMRSSMYRVFDLSMKEGYHWYTPSTDELAGESDWARDHVKKGGLLIRKADGSPTNARLRAMAAQEQGA